MSTVSAPCPSCGYTAQVRHCGHCQWLICHECSILFDPKRGTQTRVHRKWNKASG